MCLHAAAAMLLAVTPLAAFAEVVLFLDGQTHQASGKGTHPLWSVPTTFNDASGHTRRTSISNDTFALLVDGSGSMAFGFALPQGTGFVPGTYAGATGDATSVRGEATNRSGIHISILSRACHEEEGWIKIYESEIAADGSFSRLAMDFLHYCESGPAPLFGAIRINSDIPLTHAEPYAVAGKLQRATQGETVRLDALDSFSYSASSLTYLWEQIAGPPVQLFDAATRVASFMAPDVPVGGEELQFRLTVTDAENNSGSDVAAVHAHNPADPRTRAFIHSRIGDPVFRWWRLLYSQTIPTGDNADIEYTLDETEWSMWAVKMGTYGAQVNMNGGFRPRRDRGLDFAAITGSISADFQAPIGADSPGLYLNGQRHESNSTVVPWMQFAGFGAGCGTVVGAFQIHELEFDPPTSPFDHVIANKLAIDFVVHCLHEVVEPAISGSFRMNSAIPLHDGIVPPLPPSPPVSVTLTVSPNPAQVNQPVRFTWSSTNANFCYGFNGFPHEHPIPTSGSVTTTFAAAVEQQFYLRCLTSSTMGEAFADIRITDHPPPPPPPPPPPAARGGGGASGKLDLAWMLLALMLSSRGRRRAARE